MKSLKLMTDTGFSLTDYGQEEWQKRKPIWMSGIKETAPSTELRKWFGHVPARFAEFKKLYKEELKKHIDDLKRLKSISEKGTLTLLYSAKTPDISQAIVLMEVLKKLK